MDVKIEKGIPLPSAKGSTYNDILGTLRKMEVGDSFLCDSRTANSIRGVSGRYGIKVSGRLQQNGQHRIWRIQ